MTIRFSVTPARTIPAIAMFLVLVDLAYFAVSLKANPGSPFVNSPGLQIAVAIADVIGGVGVIFFGFWEVK